MSNTSNFNSISQIKRANENAGRYFFSPSTMRMFNCRVHDAVYGGCVFVTSERNTHTTNPRAFTIRIAMSDGSINTYGGFGDYSTRYEAHSEAKFVGQALLDGRMTYNTDTYKFEMK